MTSLIHLKHRFTPIARTKTALMTRLVRMCGAAITVGAMVLLSNPAIAQEQTAEQVFDHHLTAFLDRNMPENLKDYTENSVVIIPNAVFRGKDEIEGLFAGLFAEFAQPGSSFELSEKRVVDNIVYIRWSAETPDNVYEFATDTFVIIDGKIAVQTIGLLVRPK